MRLIDADALLEILQPWRDEAERRNAPVNYKAASAILALVERMPTIEERKTGKWIQKEDPYGFFDTIPVCSECGHTTKMRETYNYCPNCGTRLEDEP